jgi:hypothetical protein
MGVKMTKLPRQTRRIAAGLPHLPAEKTVRMDTSEPSFWKDLQTIYRGLGKIDYEQFKLTVKHTINCGDDYAAAAWAQFYGDRLNYCLSRNPEKQGYALINLALQLAGQAKVKP